MIKIIIFLIMSGSLVFAYEPQWQPDTLESEYDISAVNQDMRNLAGGLKDKAGVKDDNEFTGENTFTETNLFLGNVGINQPTPRAETNLYINNDLGSNNATGIFSAVTGPGTDHYGIWLGVSGATNNYGVFSDADENYFSGKVGVGVAAQADPELNVLNNDGGNASKGIQSVVTGGGTTHYGVYTVVSGATTNYGIYSNAVKNYFTGDVSALTFTDRTPYPKDTQEAYGAVNSMELKSDGMGVDHNKLHKFIKSGDDGRNLSATVSALNEVVKDLIQRVEVLESQ